jgi:hypothetical protein
MPRSTAQRRRHGEEPPFEEPTIVGRCTVQTAKDSAILLSGMYFVTPLFGSAFTAVLV